MSSGLSCTVNEAAYLFLPLPSTFSESPQTWSTAILLMPLYSFLCDQAAQLSFILSILRVLSGVLQHTLGLSSEPADGTLGPEPHVKIMLKMKKA